MIYPDRLTTPRAPVQKAVQKGKDAFSGQPDMKKISILNRKNSSLIVASVKFDLEFLSSSD